MRVSGIRSQNRRAVSARNRARVVAQVWRGAKRVVEKDDVRAGVGRLARFQFRLWGDGLCGVSVADKDRRYTDVAQHV